MQLKFISMTLLFLVAVAPMYAQHESLEKCEIFARITIAAAEKYADENSDFLAKWIGEALNEPSVRSGTEKVLTNSCEGVMKYSTLYFELSLEGWGETITNVYTALEKLGEEDEDYIIRLYKEPK